MCFNSYDNVIYFVDGLKFENGQCYPSNDSLFCLDLDTKIVKPILSKCLSHCSDICYDNLSKAIYICEPFANRVTKAQIHKSGAIFSSIFHQFSGRLGPTSLAVDESTVILDTRPSELISKETRTRLPHAPTLY